jgi:hypothetical protein
MSALYALSKRCVFVDDNRKLVAESEVIPIIVRGLGSKNPALVRTTCGALLNLSIDSGMHAKQRITNASS